MNDSEQISPMHLHTHVKSEYTSSPRIYEQRTKGRRQRHNTERDDASVYWNQYTFSLEIYKDSHRHGQWPNGNPRSTESNVLLRIWLIYFSVCAYSAQLYPVCVYPAIDISSYRYWRANLDKTQSRMRQKLKSCQNWSWLQISFVCAANTGNYNLLIDIRNENKNADRSVESVRNEPQVLREPSKSELNSFPLLLLEKRVGTQANAFAGRAEPLPIAEHVHLGKTLAGFNHRKWMAKMRMRRCARTLLLLLPQRWLT